MQEIYNDSTDQEVYFDAVDVSGEFAVRLVGSSDGELMTGATVAVKEYKVTTASISSPVISWVQALGKWKLVVPVANITQYGYGLIFITKSGIAPVTIEFKTVHDDAYFAGAGAISALELKVDGVGDSVSDARVEIGDVKTVVDGIATTLATPNNFMADVSNLATSAEVAALNDLSAQQVWEYASRGLTAIPTGTATATALSAVQGDITSIKSTVEGISVVGGTGAEKVIPRTYYELSAVANTITLSSPYDTITEEQIISICDLTTGDVIYSCEIPIKHTISVSSGVITFTYDNNSIAAEDILQIIVNQV